MRVWHKKSMMSVLHPLSSRLLSVWQLLLHPPPYCTTSTWMLVAAWCLKSGTIFKHCQLFESVTRFCHCCCASEGGCCRSPQFNFWASVLQKMKNEAKTGFGQELGADKVRCKHDHKFNAIAMQSLMSKIALHFYLSFRINS